MCLGFWLRDAFVAQFLREAQGIKSERHFEPPCSACIMGEAPCPVAPGRANSSDAEGSESLAAAAGSDGTEVQFLACEAEVHEPIGSKCHASSLRQR
jgi:hypothetical protein